MARKTTEQRRIEIIRESSQILAQQGFHNLTTKALSKQLGIAEMILYRCFKNKNAIVLACIEETGRAQISFWQKITVTHEDPLEALATIAADFSFNPSHESTGFQLLQRLSAEILEPELTDAVAKVYLEFCDFLQSQLIKLIEFHGLEMPSEEILRHLAWVLVHWGSGLGQMQLLPIHEAHQDLFKKFQVELAINFIKGHLWST